MSETRTFSVERQELSDILSVGNLISDVNNIFDIYNSCLFNFSSGKLALSFRSEEFLLQVSNLNYESGDSLDDFRFGIETRRFYHLISNSTTSNVEFVLKEDDNTVLINTNGNYEFQLVNEDKFFKDRDEKEDDYISFNIIDFVDKCNCLKNFTVSDLINPADSGIFIGEGLIASHHPYAGLIFDFNFPKTGISFDPNVVPILNRLKKMDNTSICLLKNTFNIKGNLNDKDYFFEGRILDGQFRSVFIDYINKTLRDTKEKDFISLIIEKSDWKSFFKRVKEFLIDYKLSIGYKGGKLFAYSGNNFCEYLDDNWKIYREKDFVIEINAFDLDKFFDMFNKIGLVIPPEYSEEYPIIAVLALDEANEAIAKGFISRFD